MGSTFLVVIMPGEAVWFELAIVDNEDGWFSCDNGCLWRVLLTLNWVIDWESFDSDVDESGGEEDDVDEATVVEREGSEERVADEETREWDELVVALCLRFRVWNEGCGIVDVDDDDGRLVNWRRQGGTGERQYPGWAPTESVW
jgi:hypothetical protein